MRIAFEGTTKNLDFMDGVAIFRYPDGKEVSIDRDSTEYTCHDGKFSMVWKGCYFWDGENITYPTVKDWEELQKAEFVDFDFDFDPNDEDDANWVSTITKVTRVDIYR